MARRPAQSPASKRGDRPSGHRPPGPAKSHPPGRSHARPKPGESEGPSHRKPKPRQETSSSRSRGARNEESGRGRPKSRHGAGGVDRRLKPRQRAEPERAARPGRSDSVHAADTDGERLQKVLSRAGVASRREAEDWIRAGRITINGQPAMLGVRVQAKDQLRLDGRLIRQRETTNVVTAFICHRSPGESLTQPHAESAAEREDAPPPPSAALIERLPSRAGRRFITVSPMPRVDGGLELVTSDGELGVKLQRSVRHLVSQFSVRVLGELSPEQLENILEGSLDSGTRIQVTLCEPAGGEAANRWYTLIARGASGKEARQLFERQGALVSRVQRTHLGPITMERTLGRGQFRELTAEELGALLAPPAVEDPEED